MDKNEIRNYLKDNLKIKTIWNGDCFYVCLCLEGEIISKFKMEGV